MGFIVCQLLLTNFQICLHFVMQNIAGHCILVSCVVNCMHYEVIVLFLYDCDYRFEWRLMQFVVRRCNVHHSSIIVIRPHYRSCPSVRLAVPAPN